jgi:hypothetical protein
VESLNDSRLQFGSRRQEVEVSASVLYMSMSLDGYIAGPNDEPGNAGGDGFDRLHDWFVTPPRLPAGFPVEAAGIEAAWTPVEIGIRSR